MLSNSTSARRLGDEQLWPLWSSPFVGFLSFCCGFADGDWVLELFQFGKIASGEPNERFRLGGSRKPSIPSRGRLLLEARRVSSLTACVMLGTCHMPCLAPGWCIDIFSAKPLMPQNTQLMPPIASRRTHAISHIPVLSLLGILRLILRLMVATPLLQRFLPSRPDEISLATWVACRSAVPLKALYDKLSESACRSISSTRPCKTQCSHLLTVFHEAN